MGDFVAGRGRGGGLPAIAGLAATLILFELMVFQWCFKRKVGVHVIGERLKGCTCLGVHVIGRKGPGVHVKDNLL